MVNSPKSWLDKTDGIKLDLLGIFARKYEKIRSSVAIASKVSLLALAMWTSTLWPQEAQGAEKSWNKETTSSKTTEIQKGFEDFITKIQDPSLIKINPKYLTFFYNSVQNNWTENMFSSTPWKWIISKINPKDIPWLKIKVENYFTENPPNQKRIDEMKASYTAVKESEERLRRSAEWLRISQQIAEALERREK